MTGDVVAAWAGAGVAVVAAGLAAWQASRATKAANRSAAADERAAAAAERANEFAEEQAARYVPGWQLTHASGDSYLLTNRSEETAYGVTIGSEGGLRLSPPPTRDLAVGEAITFGAMEYFGSSSDESIVVNWRRAPEADVLTWRHPLPPKPPRTPPAPIRSLR